MKSLKGQGGADLDELSGISIPIKISGTFANPKYGMDFTAIASGLAQSKLLDKVGGEKGAAVKELIGGGDKAEALKGLLGKKKPADTTPATTPATGTKAAPASAESAPSQPAAPAEQPKSAEEIAKEKAEKKLKKLLKF